MATKKQTKRTKTRGKIVRRAPRPDDATHATAASKSVAKAGKVVNVNDARIRRARRELEKHPALEGVREKLCTIVKGGTTDDARRKHEIGRIVAKVRDDAEKYGKRSVQTLADLLGYDKSTLNDYATVAATWPAADFGKVLGRKNGLGLPLTFSHLVELASLTDKTKRVEILDRVLTENLTVLQLREVLPKREAHAKGNKPDVEPEELRAVRLKAAEWRGNIDLIKRGTARVIQQARNNPIPAVLDELKAFAKKQRAIAEQAAENATTLDAAHVELAKVKPRSSDVPSRLSGVA